MPHLPEYTHKLAIQNLQKWFGSALNIDNAYIGEARYHFPFVTFLYKKSLPKEELKKLCESQYFELLFNNQSNDCLSLKFRIPSQYEEELKTYKDITEVLTGKSGLWPFDK